MSSSLLLLLPISLLLVIAVGAAFWWAIFAGQFDNTNQAAESILLDDDTPPPRIARAAARPMRPTRRAGRIRSRKALPGLGLRGMNAPAAGFGQCEIGRRAAEHDLLWCNNSMASRNCGLDANQRGPAQPTPSC